MAGVVGCVTPGNPRPEGFGTTAVTQPGKVLVDHDVRRAELESDGEALCPVDESRLRESAVPPVAGMLTSGEWDKRFARPRDAMMQLGAACLKLGGAPCQTIVDTMLAWAKAESAIVRSCCDTERFWSNSLMINLDVARPFTGVYNPSNHVKIDCGIYYFAKAFNRVPHLRPSHKL